jgi:fibronectin type 3 domain-containing protein
MLTVSPSSANVLPNGTLQYTDMASDQFGNPYTATPVSWTVTAGGTIDNTGKFTAGSGPGGPYTVTASTGGLSATASVTVFSNLAPNGTAYRWFALSSTTSNANRTASPGLNDNNLTTDVALSSGGDDVANAYEAGGIVWAASQSIGEVTFTNGSFNNSTYDGVFDNNFGVQVTTDGTTWTNVSGWSLSPTYSYDVPAAAGLTYVFSGPAQSVLGVRVVGQVHSLSGNDSWYDNATEVQAFGAATSNSPPTVTGLSPSSGGLGGGTSVAISGSNFTGATGVSFGGVAATSFTVNSDTQITAVAPAAAAAGSVDVTVTNANGTSVTSTADEFSYVSPPTISGQPASLTVNAGQSASFTVSASGPGTLTYQWQILSSGTWTNINGATSATFTIAAAAATDAGSYEVTVANAGGSVTSNTVTLTVNTPAPAAPTGLSATAGDSQVSLSWKSSTGTTSYRIYRGTSPGTETLLASPKGTATTYVDSTATNGTTYYYEVTAVNSTGESPPSAEVSATPQANNNLATKGTAYRWWHLTSSTSNANRSAAPGLNDNNLTTDVVLSGNGNGGQGDDYKNAYEAAGILWSTPQTIVEVKYTNGSFSSSYDGVFDANFGLQYTTNGTTWLPVTGWTVTPNYAYNSAAAGNVTYTFSGPALTVLGVRVVGQVHTSDVGNNSWFARATEVQVFG